MKLEINVVIESINAKIAEQFVESRTELTSYIGTKFNDRASQTNATLQGLDQQLKTIDKHFEYLEERVSALEVSALEIAIIELGSKIDKVYMKSTLTTISVLGTLITIFGVFNLTH